MAHNSLPLLSTINGFHKQKHKCLKLWQNMFSPVCTALLYVKSAPFAKKWFSMNSYGFLKQKKWPKSPQIDCSYDNSTVEVISESA